MTIRTPTCGRRCCPIFVLMSWTPRMTSERPFRTVGEFKPSFRSGFGLVLDVVLGTGFDKFWEGENHGLGLTPPGFRWFSPVLELSRRTAEFEFSIGRTACHRITEISCNDRCGASTNGAPTSNLGPPACSSRLTCHKIQSSCGF